MTYDRADSTVISLAVSICFTASPSRVWLRFDVVGDSVCRAMRHVVSTWIQASDLISAMADRRSIMSAIIFMRWADHLGEIASLSS